MTKKKLLVIGGGAAGFFCAVNAAQLNPSLQVTIAEKTGHVLQKVKVSGGGRCNVTHACFDIREMAARYPRGEIFLRKAFHHFFTTDTIEWFQSRGVALKTEDDGRMFPEANTSQAIIDCLLNEMHSTRVQLQLHFPVEKIEPLKEGFNIYYRKGEVMYADYVMIACGGFPKINQFEWLKNLKLQVESPVPSLFTFNFPGHPLNKLMGVSAGNAVIQIAGSKRISHRPVLITHWGLSGPAVLRLSAFAARELAALNYQFTVLVNWCADDHEQSFSEKVR
ncbi:MAG TPA: aminoacetone oxidase family FAD-binding enzyme [Chitinophagales bacterium]|nr:aminoacetone oxidase family FAD-binding enzyme [Chitinophagales bacterium]